MLLSVRVAACARAVDSTLDPHPMVICEEAAARRQWHWSARPVCDGIESNACTSVQALLVCQHNKSHGAHLEHVVRLQHVRQVEPL